MRLHDPVKRYGKGGRVESKFRHFGLREDGWVSMFFNSSVPYFPHPQKGMIASIFPAFVVRIKCGRNGVGTQTIIGVIVYPTSFSTTWQKTLFRGEGSFTPAQTSSVPLCLS